MSTSHLLVAPQVANLGVVVFPHDRLLVSFVAQLRGTHKSRKVHYYGNHSSHHKDDPYSIGVGEGVSEGVEERLYEGGW